MKIKINYMLFYTAYLLTIMSTMFTRVNFISKYIYVFNYISVIILIILFFINLFSSKYIFSAKRILLFVFLICISFMSYKITSDVYLFRFFLLLVCFNGIDLKKFVKFDLISKISLIIFVVFLYYCGLTSSEVTFRNGIMRNPLGFSHPNMLGLYLSMISLDIYYLYNKNNSFLLTCLLIIIAVIIKFVCDSRASLIIVIVLIIISIFNNKKGFNKIINNTVIKKIIPYSYLILTILSFTMLIVYKNSSNIGFIIDKIFSGRLYWANNYLNIYKMNLFGNNLFIPNVKTLYQNVWYLCVDNSYVYLILEYGLLFWTFFTLAYYKTIKYFYKKNDYKIIIILMLLALYGLMETQFVKIQYDAFLLVFSYVLLESNKKDDLHNSKKSV